MRFRTREPVINIAQSSKIHELRPSFHRLELWSAGSGLFALTGAAAIAYRKGLLWVKNGPDGPEMRLPVYPRKRTCSDYCAMSVSCHEQSCASLK
jgi:hypothetical protein